MTKFKFAHASVTIRYKKTMDHDEKVPAEKIQNHFTESHIHQFHKNSTEKYTLKQIHREKIEAFSAKIVRKCLFQ